MSFQNLLVDITQLPQAAALHFDDLPMAHRREVVCEQGVVWSICITVAMLVLTLGVGRSWWIAVAWSLGCGLPAAALSMALAYYSAKVKGIALREKDIAYRSGILWRKVTILAFNRIQHVELAHGPISRRFGLATLKFFTAGGTQVDLKIPGLLHDRANRLRQFVLTQMGDHCKVSA